MNLSKEQIENLERKYRLNIINSITGIKPANLIGTKSRDGKENLAIFSSIVHLGSSPAQIGFVLRPQEEKESDTYKNIRETHFYTINHVSKNLMQRAHYTSAKLPDDESEFERMNIDSGYFGEFSAPFVLESPVKIGMKLVSEIDLPNGCIFIIGEVQQIIIPDDCVNELGYINLQSTNSAGIGGLNSYYGLEKMVDFPYVRLDEIPQF